MSRALRILSIEARQVERSLSRSIGGTTHRTNMRRLVEISVQGAVDDRVCFGSGEASPLPGYCLDTAADVETEIRALRAVLPWTLSLNASVVSAIEQKCADLLPAARAAVETALLDIVGQAQHRPLWSLLTGSIDSPPPVPLASQLLGPVAEFADEAQRLRDLGYRTLKCKVDSIDAVDRLACLATLSGTALRLDANRSLSCEILRTSRPMIDRLRPALFEEPIGDLARKLAEDEPALRNLPIAIDESLIAKTADEALLELEAFTPFMRSKRVVAVVVKPTRDGLIGALRLARAAQAAGADAIVTHCWEGAIGCLAAAHLSLALHRTGGPAHAPTLPPGLIRDEQAPAQIVLDLAVKDGMLAPLQRAGLGAAQSHG